MKPMRRTHRFLLSGLISSAVICLFFFAPEAVASGETTPGRRLWDTIILWFNFGVLVFVFVKYAKNPLMDFLRSVREKIQGELEKNESQLDEVKSIMDGEAEKLQNIDNRIQEVRGLAIEMGKREKEKIIEEAKLSAERMIKSAKIYSQHRIAVARKVLSDQMVDIAVGMVEERLTKGLSDEDNVKLFNQFVTDLITSKERFNQDFK